MKKYILGMAKSSLDLRGGKSRNLELDYLRLVYAISLRQHNGLETMGYLFVATDEAKRRTEQWKIKYEAEDRVKVITGESLSEKDRQILKMEKERNKLGLTGNGNKQLSIAKEGDFIGRRVLKEVIEEENPGVVDLTAKKELFPMQIMWDYYGETK